MKSNTFLTIYGLLYQITNNTYITDKLKTQLSEITNYPMTLIVAPAGYGKSTAITWWDEYRRTHYPDSVFYRINVLCDDLSTTWDELCRVLKKMHQYFLKKNRIKRFTL